MFTSLEIPAKDWIEENFPRHARCPFWRLSRAQQDELRQTFAYFQTVGRMPVTRFESGLGRAQWEYGKRGDYYSKDAREGVRIASTVREVAFEAVAA